MAAPQAEYENKHFVDFSGVESIDNLLCLIVLITFFCKKKKEIDTEQLQ